MELCVLHYHYRPGGVRQVIATGLPALARAGGFTSVHFGGGEARDAAWCEEMERALHPLPVRWTLHPALGYWSESQPERAEVETALDSLASREAVLWAHNLSVGRNFHLSRAVGQSASKWKSVWLHHHDWWWDGRWQRWPELQAQGAGDLMEAVKVTLPAAENVRHFTINSRDAALLSRWLGGHVTCVENPVLWQPLTPQETAHAKEWLRHLTGCDTHWLYPCRILRRKNIAEALLVQRWLAPGAATVTTGGPSSAAELPYTQSLTDAAERNGWPLFTGVCTATTLWGSGRSAASTLREAAGVPLLPCGERQECRSYLAGSGRADAPSVPALMAAADAIVVTSLQEGFGLPYREAALAGRPLFARILPCIAGPAVPVEGAWLELPVPRDAFDLSAESARTAQAWQTAALLLPTELRREPRSVAQADFGSLSLAAQIEVLQSDPRHTHPGGIFPPIRQSASACAVRTCTPEEWAAQLLNSARHPAAAQENGWAQRAPEMLQPLVHEWLGRPLLFTA